MSARAAEGGRLRAGVAIEAWTIGWMIVEAAMGLGAGLAAGSVALTAFGADSIIELVSAFALLWRLGVERRGGSGEHVERAERRAAAVVGWCLLLLALYVVVAAGRDLWIRSAPEPAPLGIALAASALLVMPLLVHVKRRIAGEIGSAALRGDAACGIVCAYMAATLLAGLALRAVLGWWWADPLAALGLVYFVVREGREALAAARGEACGCGDGGATRRKEGDA